MSSAIASPKEERKCLGFLLRLKGHKGKQERVVKSNLQDRPTEKKLISKIQQWFSAIFNRLLRRCTNAKKPLSDLTNQTFNDACFNIVYVSPHCMYPI